MTRRRCRVPQPRWPGGMLEAAGQVGEVGMEKVVTGWALESEEGSGMFQSATWSGATKQRNMELEGRH